MEGESKAEEGERVAASRFGVSDHRDAAIPMEHETVLHCQELTLDPYSHYRTRRCASSCTIFSSDATPPIDR